MSDCEYVLVRKNNDVLAVSAVEVQLHCALMRHNLHSVITDALNYFNILFLQISKYKISARMTVPPLKKQSAASVRTHEDLMTD